MKNLIFLFSFLAFVSCNKKENIIQKIEPVKNDVDCSIFIECINENGYLKWKVKIKTSEEVVVSQINWRRNQFYLQTITDSVELQFVEYESAMRGDLLFISKEGVRAEALDSVVFLEYVVR